MKKRLVTTLLAGLSVSVLAACQSDSASESAADSGQVETINVAVGNAYYPFTYLDDNGDPAGYDIEVLKAVDEKLDQYEFVYQPYEFKSILTAIDTGQARIATHQYAKNPEREANYLFGNEPFTTYESFIITDADSDFEPETFDDLVDHTVFVAAGTNYSTALLEYNEENEGQIDVQMGEMQVDVIANELLSGNADATLFTLYDFYNYNLSYDGAFKRSQTPVMSSETYYVFGKDDTELQSDVDAAIVELREEGVLDQLESDIILPDEIIE